MGFFVCFCFLELGFGGGGLPSVVLEVFFFFFFLAFQDKALTFREDWKV